MSVARHPKHHVIYIPGLGDTKNVPGQRAAVRTWRLYGLHGHCHPVVWSRKSESFDDKLTGVLAEIDDLLAAGHRVSIVASSAGASMALHAYQARKKKIVAVVLICGEVGDAKNIASPYFEENPAFKLSMERLPETLSHLVPEERQRIMSLHPIYDEIVPIADTQLDGVHMSTVVSFLHAPTIGLMLTVGFYAPSRFLKRCARQQG